MERAEQDQLERVINHELNERFAAGAEQRAGMEEIRRELSLRLPSARLLEFTFDDPARPRRGSRGFPISRAVHIGIPFARSVNPVTGTNWQGSGVMPDVAVPEAQAYDIAYARALEHVLGLDDVPPRIADEARATLAGLGPAQDATRPAADQGWGW